MRYSGGIGKELKNRVLRMGCPLSGQLPLYQSMTTSQRQPSLTRARHLPYFTMSVPVGDNGLGTVVTMYRLRFVSSAVSVAGN